MTGHESILDAVETYYTGKVRAHGATSNGVDWNSTRSQELRFQILLKLLTDDPALPADGFDLLDFGCGYGALADYLGREHPELSHRMAYLGFDISTEMIECARERVSDPGRRFVSYRDDVSQADYTVASGIFNVKQETSQTDWDRYVLDTISELHALSRRGFAFNVLTSYSDEPLMRDDLYYADPCHLFDHCKRRLSRHVSLIHDYGLYEFTLIVRRED